MTSRFTKKTIFQDFGMRAVVFSALQMSSQGSCRLKRLNELKTSANTEPSPKLISQPKTSFPAAEVVDFVTLQTALKLMAKTNNHQINGGI